MKKQMKKQMIIVLMVTVTVLAGCGKANVVGIYQSSVDEVFDIKKDGSVQFYDYGDEEEDKYNGTWQVKGDTLYMTVNIDGNEVKFESPINDDYIAPDVTTDNYGWVAVTFMKK